MRRSGLTYLSLAILLIADTAWGTPSDDPIEPSIPDQNDDEYLWIENDNTDTDALILESIETIGEDIAQQIETFDERTLHSHVVSMSEISPSTELSQALSQTVSAHISDHGSRLQHKGFAFRGAAAQDIVIRYEGIAINALSDASADLAMIPAQLLDSAQIFASGAGSVSGAPGGLVELISSENRAPIQATLTGSTLKDFGLFVHGGIFKPTWQIDAAAFGDYAHGKFSYIDAQGTRQQREHNAASRFGAQIRTKLETAAAKLSAFSFISVVERQEAGLSEYPAKYALASQDSWLSLSRIHADFLPIQIGDALATFQINLSHRASHDAYQNPTAFIGGTKTHSEYLENRTTATLSSTFIASDWSQTHIELEYDGQHVDASHLVSGYQKQQIHSRHAFALSFSEKVSFLEDTLQAALSFRADFSLKASPMLAPCLGLNWQITDSIELWLSSAMAERLPTFDEQYYQTEYIRGNPNLRPQQSILNELGFAFKPADWLELKLMGFYNLHTNLIRFMPVTPYLYEARNITHSTVGGTDISVRSAFWRGFSIEGKYAWVNAITGSGYPMPTIPEHHVQAALSWDDPIWHADVQVTYATGIPRNMTGTAYSPPKLRLNTHLTFRFYPSWSLHLDLYNLLNDQRSEDALQRPLPGRHGFVSLKYTL